MNTKFLILLLSLTSLKAQVGIGTNEPKATLHIETANPYSPTNTDGILIPKVSKLTSNPQLSGQLVFLEDADNSGFYYWNGEEWITFIPNISSRVEDKSIYVASGIGYIDNGVLDREVVFSDLVAYDTTGFSIANNTITIGKKGTYLINFNSALKKHSTNNYRATYRYIIKRNGTMIFDSYSSISNEPTASASVSANALVDLSVGDLITVVVRRINKDAEQYPDEHYVGFGTNTLTLNYLNN